MTGLLSGIAFSTDLIRSQAHLTTKALPRPTLIALPEALRTRLLAIVAWSERRESDHRRQYSPNIPVRHRARALQNGTTHHKSEGHYSSVHYGRLQPHD